MPVLDLAQHFADCANGFTISLVVNEIRHFLSQSNHSSMNWVFFLNFFFLKITQKKVWECDLGM